MKDFGDYVVFVDESGDQSMTKVDSGYPIFVLAFRIFEKQYYCNDIVPRVLNFKMKFFGSEIPILHEHEMRKSENAFNLLLDETIRNEFYSDLNEIMTQANYQIISSLIDKNRYQLLPYQTNIYSMSARFGIERVLWEMKSRNQAGKRIPIIFESRGKREDKRLMEALDHICSSVPGAAEMFDVQCVSKKCNCIGLQFSDMVARPIGMHYLKPGQNNRAWNMLEPKFRKSAYGKMLGYGLKIYP